MRYFVLPREGLSDDLKAALTRGLGLSLQDPEACARHCDRYGVEDVAAFVDELGEAQAALATAKAVGASIQVDWQGRLCYDLPQAPDDGTSDGGAPDEGGLDRAPWKDDAWLAALVGDRKLA